MKKSLSRKRISSKRKNLLKRTLKKNYRKRVRNSSKRVKVLKRTLKKNNRYSRKKIRKQRGGGRPPRPSISKMRNNFLDDLDNFELVSVEMSSRGQMEVYNVTRSKTSKVAYYHLSVTIRKITNDVAPPTEEFTPPTEEFTPPEEFTYGIMRRYSDLYENRDLLSTESRDMLSKSQSQHMIKFPPKIWGNLSYKEIQVRAEGLNKYFSKLNQTTLVGNNKLPDIFRPGYIWEAQWGSWHGNGDAESQIIAEINSAISRRQKSIRVRVSFGEKRGEGRDPNEKVTMINNTDRRLYIYKTVYRDQGSREWRYAAELPPRGEHIEGTSSSKEFGAVGEDDLWSEWSMIEEYGINPTIFLESYENLPNERLPWFKED